MTDFDLQKLWEKEIQILDEIDRICKKYSIEYYLVWGTLLGAVRHKGFIPWDDDIDVGMPRKHYKKFLKVAKKELSQEYFLQTPKTDKYSLSYFSRVRLCNTALYIESDKTLLSHHGIFVDVMPMDNCRITETPISKFKKNVFERANNLIIAARKTGKKVGRGILRIIPMSIWLWVRDWALKGSGDYYLLEGEKLQRKDFSPAIELTFANKKYSAPKNYDNILTTLYGNYMELPPEDKRIAHSPAFISYDLEHDKEKLEKFLESLGS